MVKKIASSRPTRAGSLSATPFKVARKAPPKKAAVKVSKKAVAKKKLPQTLDWGKKVPKDHLSYLSKEEMKVLQKNRSFKGKRSFKGVPAFPDPVDTGYGDRGQGTKSSTGTTSAPSSTKSGNTSGGAGGQRGAGSNTGPGSARPGSDSGLGGGNKGGYNSGTSGSRYGGASTQSPGMGRNEGRVGPQSPMSGQGTSFRSPADARAFQRSQLGVEDQTGRMGPFRGEQPNGLSFDKEGNFFNPNNPEKWLSDRLDRTDVIADDDRFYRKMAKSELGPKTNPREIREYVGRMNAKANASRAQMDAEAIKNKMGDPSFNSREARNSISTPDMRVGAASRGFAGGKENRGGGYRAGGVVKRKTFKKK